MDIAAELEEAILSDEGASVSAIEPKESVSSKSYGVWLRFERYFPEFIKRVVAALRAKLATGRQHYFNVLMEPNLRKCFPYVLYPGRKSVYLFDAWPVHHEMISQFVKTHHLSFVFVSSSQAAVRLKDMSGSSVFSWVPEGLDPSKYKHYHHEAKDIDVLELGRKYDVYHDHIVEALEDDGRVHLYEKTKGIYKFFLTLALKKRQINFDAFINELDNDSNAESSKKSLKDVDVTTSYKDGLHLKWNVAGGENNHFQGAGFARLAGSGFTRRLIGAAFETDIAETARTALGDQKGLPGGGQVADDFLGVPVGHHRAHRHVDI